MKIKVKDECLKCFTGKFVTDDDVIIFANYKVYKIKQSLQVFGLCILLLVLGVLLYVFYRLPMSIHVEPVERVYAVNDNNSEHYQVYVTSIFGKQYSTKLAKVNVGFGLDDQLDVRASLFGMFQDTIRVIPIAKDGVVTEYTETVYEGDVLDKEYVKTYILFKDGHKIEQLYDVSIPTGEVRGPVQLCTTIEQFNRFYTTVEPVMSECLVAEYDGKLYQGCPFDLNNVKWRLRYTDGYERDVDDVVATVDTNIASESLVVHGVSKYQSNDVILESIRVSGLNMSYSADDILYEGDLVNVNDLQLNVNWKDGRSEILSGSDVINDVVYASENNNIDTIYGNVFLSLDVIGVDSVRLQNLQDSYSVGDIINPSGFIFKYNDDTERYVDVSDVSLLGDWSNGLLVGVNQYRFMYHGSVYSFNINVDSIEIDDIDNNEHDDDIGDSYVETKEHETKESDGIVIEDDITVMPTPTQPVTDIPDGDNRDIRETETADDDNLEIDETTVVSDDDIGDSYYVVPSVSAD